MSTRFELIKKKALMDKKELRSMLRERLGGMSIEQRSEKSIRACRNLISTREFQDASCKVIMMYLSLEQELDTSEAIVCALELGRKVVVPKVCWQEKLMTAVELKSLEEAFTIDAMGLRNPANSKTMPLEQIDMVVTPGLGFDAGGNRLGRGGGYYDKFFANSELKAVKCGIGFAEQVVDSVPTTARDVAMDILVTDEQVRYFENR